MKKKKKKAAAEALPGNCRRLEGVGTSGQIDHFSMEIGALG